MLEKSTPTEELTQEQTSDLLGPVIIEGTIAASDVTSTDPPDEPDISKHPTVPLAPLEQPKRFFQLNWWSIIALALFLVLVGEHTIPLVLPVITSFLHPEATVTIFPAQKTLRLTYSYLVVTGTADQSRLQIPSRHISFTTPTRTGTINTTGIGYTPAVQAMGSVTFYNEAPYVQTIQAGTVINGTNGIQIVTDAGISIAPGNGVTNGSAEAPAHTIQAGTRANIPPLSINTLCCLNGILAKNMIPFTGGEDPKPYPMLSNADLQREATHLAGTLSTSAKEGIQSRMRNGEQNLVPMQCSARTISHPKAGQRAATARVSLSETCMTQVYDYSEVASLTKAAFSKDALSEAGSNFVEHGNLTIVTQKTSLLDRSHSTYKLEVSASGTLVFHLSPTQLQTLKTQIAGKSVAEAKQKLLELTGVQGVSIQPGRQTDTALPIDPGQIQITVMTGS